MQQCKEHTSSEGIFPETVETASLRAAMAGLPEATDSKENQALENG